MKQILSFTLALLLIIAVVPFSAIAVGGTAQSGIATPDEAMIAYLYGTENNIAYGKNYEIGVTGAGYEQYTADLTDGVASHNTGAFDDAWFAFCYSEYGGILNTENGMGTITIDLGEVYSVDNIKLNFGHATQAGVSAAESVEFYFSEDGVEFTKAEEISNSILNETLYPEYDEMTYWAEFDLTDENARYVRIEITLKNYFVFLNEIVVHKTEEMPRWNGATADEFESGNGSMSSPFVISTAAQLAHMAEMVNSGDGTYYYELANDIYLNDVSVENWAENANQWNPIGTTENPFDGVFNGNGNTIYGLYINSNADNVGLFGVIDRVDGGFAKTCISDITVSDSYVKGRSNVGGIAGKVIDTIPAEEYYSFHNCINKAVVEGEFNVGGIAGYISNGSFVECANDGVVSGVYGVGGMAGNSELAIYITCENNGELFGGDALGGISGICKGTIAMELVNNGHIKGNSLAGGIFGLVCGGIATGMMNNGEIEACYFVGGIAGYAKESFIDTVENYGEISAIDFVGGIAGKFYYTDIYTGSNNADVYGERYVGGMVGVNYGWCTFNELENNGDIYGTDCVAGILGEANEAEIEFCHNGGYVGKSLEGAAAKLFGGIAGASYNTLIRNCYNSGDICGGNFAGGISGNPHYDTIKNCYNAGNISGDASWDISGFSYCGGIIGVYDEYMPSEIENCYYLDTTADLGIAGVWEYDNQRTLLFEESENVIPLTHEEMLSEESYVGFGFGSIWTMGMGGYTYPVLLGGHIHYYDWLIDGETHLYACEECGDIEYSGEHIFSPWETYDGVSAYRYCQTCGEFMGEREIPDESKIISVGKKYTVTANGKFDPYTAKLTDGIASEYIYSFDDQWFAVHYNHETGENTNTVEGVCSIVIDMEYLSCIENVAINFANIQSCAVNPAEWVRIYTSADGEEYEFMGEMDVCRYDEVGFNYETAYWSYLDIDNVDARYVKVEIKVGDFFVFLNEIQVYGTAYEIPEDPVKPEDPDKPEEKIMKGDINGNDKIDMTDYILLKRAYFGTFKFNDKQNKAGDINKNNKIDMTDYILLKRAYFGTFTIK